MQHWKISTSFTFCFNLPCGCWKLSTWWRHQMEIFSALLAICAGNSPVTGEFRAQRPVARSFDIFFGLRLNKRWSKQWWGWWFETPSRPLWRHCIENSRINELIIRKVCRNGFYIRPVVESHFNIVVYVCISLCDHPDIFLEVWMMVNQVLDCSDQTKIVIQWPIIIQISMTRYGVTKPHWVKYALGVSMTRKRLISK